MGDVVKANPITPSAAAPVSSPAIDAAAGKLASAAYPFLKEVDWTSDLSLKPLPGASPKAVLKAIDKALVMGAAMDGAALKEAANAYVKAIGSIDAKGLTSQADFAAINAGLGKAIASVPTSKVMDVYNAFAKVVPGTVPNFLYSTVNPNDAQAAYRGLLEFKDVVKGHRQHRRQRRDLGRRLRGRERGARPRGRLGADFEGHGRLQRLRQDRPWARAQQAVLRGGRERAEGGGGGAPQGHRQHRRQRLDVGRRLRGRERGARPRDRFGADLEGHGRLQRLRQDRPWRRAQQAVLHGGPSGGECRCQGVLRVQGRGEGSPLSRAPRAEAEELPGQHTSRGVSMHIVFFAFVRFYQGAHRSS